MRIVGTNVIAPVVPLDTSDTHPSHEARWGKGGYRTVASAAERDAIPAPRREPGMLVYVELDRAVWQLGHDLQTWTLFTGGGGGGGALELPLALIDVQTGDLLRFADGMWRNAPETQITDGGNW